MKREAIYWLGAIAILIGIALSITRCYKREMNMQQWIESREITVVEVNYGKGIDNYGYQYKPEWMDIREYREQILELNGMKNCTLYNGQELKLYVVKEENENA